MEEGLAAIASLVVPNLAEYYTRGLRHSMTPSEIVAWRDSSARQADMALFWGGDGKIVITPQPLTPLFVRDVCDRLQYQNIVNVTPAPFTASLCTDILEDVGLQQVLRAMVARCGTDSVEIKAWGPTPEFYGLLGRLSAWETQYTAPETPPEACYWASVYFGSKAGFRETCLWLREKVPEIRIAPGYTCADRQQAIDVAGWLLKQGHGVAVKANLGVGGWGTDVISTSRVRSEPVEAILADIHREIQGSMYGSGPIVVEQFIETPPGVAYSNPGIDVLIRPDGSVQPMDAAVMLIRDGRYYEGVTYGLIPLPSRVESTIQAVAHAMGEHLSGIGYRGWFDIDFVVAEGDEVFMIETNTRRLGDDHILVIRDRYRALMGVANPAVIGEDSVFLKRRAPILYEEVRRVFQDTEEALAPADFWLLPTFVAELQEVPHRLGYAVVAPTPTRARQVRHAFRQALEQAFG